MRLGAAPPLLLLPPPPPPPPPPLTPARPDPALHLAAGAAAGGSMGKGEQPIKINTRRGRANLECMDEVRAAAAAAACWPAWACAARVVHSSFCLAFKWLSWHSHQRNHSAIRLTNCATSPVPRVYLDDGFLHVHGQVCGCGGQVRGGAARAHKLRDGSGEGGWRAGREHGGRARPLRGPAAAGSGSSYSRQRGGLHLHPIVMNK